MWHDKITVSLLNSPAGLTVRGGNTNLPHSAHECFCSRFTQLPLSRQTRHISPHYTTGAEGKEKMWEAESV